MNIEKIAAFSYKGKGGNPAGVVFTKEMLSDKKMLDIAKKVNYSETAFLIKEKKSFRIRYFSPEIEIPFCGHATIASGYLIGKKYGFGKYTLLLNNGQIDIEVNEQDSKIITSISSMKTKLKEIEESYINSIIDNFSFDKKDLDKEYPIKVSFSGNNHLIIFLKEKEKLKKMKYNFSKIKELMKNKEIATINILWKENDDLYHSRNAFAYGGVVEDPATVQLQLRLVNI